jgi:hypothetical protein
MDAKGSLDREWAVVTALVVALGLAVSCGDDGGGSKAEAAKGRLTKCGLLGEGEVNLGEPEADEKCEADCLIKASCDDLEIIFCATGEDQTQVSETLQKCYAACEQTVDCELVADDFIDAAYKCNYFEECKDGSDEKGCPAAFKCDDGATLPPHYECDHEEDCQDGSDEKDCPDYAKFSCKNGDKVPAEHECDLFPDCDDGSDEHDGCAKLMCE